jgi:hypothetical protein
VEEEVVAVGFHSLWQRLQLQLPCCITTTTATAIEPTVLTVLTVLAEVIEETAV